MSCNKHNYIPTQAISVAKSCFYCVFLKKKYNMNAEVT